MNPAALLHHKIILKVALIAGTAAITHYAQPPQQRSANAIQPQALLSHGSVIHPVVRGAR